MSRVFNKVPLLKEGVTLPPSLPLVLPSNCSFDLETQQLTENKEDVSSDAGINYKLVPETVELLESITKPVAVLSICGPYRSGKSYFLSRMLGRKETFKLGHTMEACTRGIWMASSVLECDEFMLLLLDTEGIDAADKSNAGVANLLILMMLLSSTFIYNSKNVPRQRDLKKVGGVVKLSEHLMDGTNDQIIKNFLPEFIWLLRNVHYTIQDSFGNPLSPTKYVTSLNETTSKLLQRFPTFKCFTIPPPSDEVSILTNITANHDSLSAVFNQKVDSTIHWLKRNLEAKAVGSSATKCDGKMLAHLMEQYFTQISRSSGKVPNFQASWLKAIELRLMKLADSLVSEYDRDMQAQLEGKLPMVEGTNGETGETLMSIHLQVFAKKRLHLQNETERFQTSEFCSFDPDPLSSFEEKIAEYVSGKVVGGQLFKFVEQNIKASENYCVSAYIELYKKIVRPKVEKAKNTQVPTTINEQLGTFRSSYFKRTRAKGPAAHDIFEARRSESIRFEEELSLIPGPVQSLDVVVEESGMEHINLRWERPKVNAEAVKEYLVMKRFRDVNWVIVAIESECSASISGLKSATNYDFAVFAKSEKYTGMKAAIVRVETAMSRTAKVALCASAVVAPSSVLPNVLVARDPSDTGENIFWSIAGTLFGFIPVVGHALALDFAQEFAGCRAFAKEDQVFNSLPEDSLSSEACDTTQTATDDSIPSDHPTN